MPLHLKFADAAEGDANALASLRVSAMRESLERIGRFDETRARQRFLAGFSPGLTRKILLEEKLAGFLVLRPDEGEGWLLDHLYIEPGHQGCGIGSWALARVFAEADLAGQRLRVGALKGSESNRFYMRHGFRLVQQEEWDNYYVREPNAAGSASGFAAGNSVATPAASAPFPDGLGQPDRPA
jgi:GNAT superfamily N-acetyltransferase